MVRIAVLSEQLAAQLRSLTASGSTPPPELAGIEVVWSGSSLSEFKQRVPSLRAQVLALDLAQIAQPGSSEVRRSELDDLLALTGAELALVLYSYAARDLLRQLSLVGERARAVKAPVSLAGLRLNMMSLLVRDTLQASASAELAPVGVGGGGSAGASASNLVAVGSASASMSTKGRLIGGDGDFGAPLPVGSARLFTPAQLGRLQEIASSVRCECPNHLAELVSSLAAFEEYSKRCENRDAADAAMHAKLYRETSRARRLMEEALIALCRYVRIDL